MLCHRGIFAFAVTWIGDSDSNDRTDQGKSVDALKVRIMVTISRLKNVRPKLVAYADCKMSPVLQICVREI
jgi:hypothetical protein